MTETTRCNHRFSPLARLISDTCYECAWERDANCGETITLPVPPRLEDLDECT